MLILALVWSGFEQHKWPFYVASLRRVGSFSVCLGIMVYQVCLSILHEKSIDDGLLISIMVYDCNICLTASVRHEGQWSLIWLYLVHGKLETLSLLTGYKSFSYRYCTKLSKFRHFAVKPIAFEKWCEYDRMTRQL